MNNGIYIDIENAVRGLSEDQLSMFIAGLQFAKRSLEDIVVEFDDDGGCDPDALIDDIQRTLVEIADQSLVAWKQQGGKF